LIKNSQPFGKSQKTAGGGGIFLTHTVPYAALNFHLRRGISNGNERGILC